MASFREVEYMDAPRGHRRRRRRRRQRWGRVAALLLIVVCFFSYGQLLLMTYRVDPAEVTVGGEYQINGMSFHDEDVIIRCEGKNIYLTNPAFDKQAAVQPQPRNMAHG